MEEENNDEDVGIDFSKVKNLFKKKRKEETKVDEIKSIDEKNEKDNSLDKSKEEIIDKAVKKEKVEIVGTGDDELISIDFSKIKNFFKRDKRAESSEQDDEIGVDLKQTSKTLIKFTKKYQVVLLILIPILISTFFRMYPADMPITDEWAESSVYNNLRNQIRSQVNQEYPNLPDANKNILVEAEFEKVLKQEKKQIDDQIKSTSDYFKSKMQDDSGQTYLLAIDPYLWYGESYNYINNGHFGTEVVDGKEINFLRNGREGRQMPKIKLNSYLGVLLYKISDIFGNVSLMSVFFLIPVIIIGLSIIPAFFIGRRVGGNLGGFIAGMVIAINSSLLGRTPAGFSDTDPYNIFFPLMIMWLFLEAFEAKDLKKKIIYASLAGLSVGFFSYSWLGWWYIFDFVLVMIAGYFVYLIIINYSKFKLDIIKHLFSSEIKGLAILGGIFFFVSAIFVILFQGFKIFLLFFKGPFDVIALKDVAVTTLWPNVLTTVAEFNVVKLGAIISQMGGKFLFFLAVVGIFLTMIVKNSKGKRDVKYALFLTIWFIGTAYGFTRGMRFSILMVPAFAIAFGVCVGIIYKYLREWMSKELHINKLLVSVILIIIILLLIGISPVPVSSTKIPFCTHGICREAHNTAKSEIPSMSDAWYESLRAIKEDSEDAIITSWWDFGHWFVAISERRVTFDGADQGERIHWVGKSLLTDNEEEAIGILRMLNCGQEKAPHVLEKYLNDDTVKAIDVLNEIMLQDKEDAIRTLENEGLSDNEIKDVVEVTHCDDLIPQYYIASEDMIGKSGVWGHFGSWDFRRAKMHNKVKDMSYEKGINFLKEEFNMSDDEADKIYYEIKSTDADRWISPWPGYMSGLIPSSVEGRIVTCSNGIKIDLDDYNTEVPTQQGIKNPNSIVYATKDGLLERKFDSAMGVSVALIPEGKGYNCLLIDPLLAKSTFTRLFFFNGHGSKYFKPFTDKTTVTGQRILVFKVDWKPNKMSIMDELEEKIEVKEGDQVTVDYIGWTEEDGVFDSSIVNWRDLSITYETKLKGDYNSDGFIFGVGSGQVIPGFDKGVVGMKINSEKVIEIPPEDAYGLDPNAHPLGNKTLFFRIKVSDIS